MWPEDRRVMVLYVDEEWMLQALDACLNPDKNSGYRLTATLSLKDVKLVRVTHCWDRRAFGFLLSHPTFDPVPDGGLPPMINDRIKWKWRVETSEGDTPHLTS